jgi:Zn-dependent M28 family amino/carboxypeptidase
MIRRGAVAAVVATTIVCSPRPEAESSRWWSHVVALANDSLEGRESGSEGERRAALYVATQFRLAGLRPAGTGGYLQPVQLNARRVIESASRIELIRAGSVEPLVLGEDLVINPAADPTDFIEAPLVFAGYGLRIPEVQHDDFSRLDVRGAIVVRLAGAPSGIPDQLRAHYQSPLEFSRALLESGAVGVVNILDPRTPAAWAQVRQARDHEVMDLARPGAGPAATLGLNLTVNPARADSWFAGSGYTLDTLMALARNGAPVPTFPLLSSLRARIRVERRDVESQNVIAVLPGADRTVQHESVILTAHLDHLGFGKPVNGDRVYNGALDNAGGVATLLELAYRFSQTPGARPRRSLVFLVLTGEEKGLLGSRYFTSHPTVDVASVLAVINCDMFLPIHPVRVLTAFGMNESSLGGIVRAVTHAWGVEAQDDPMPQRNTFVRSDQYAFVRKGIPSLMVGIGAARESAEERLQQAWFSDRYHTPSDDLAQPIDLAAAEHFNRLVMALTQAVGNHATRPAWNADSFFRRFRERPE